MSSDSPAPSDSKAAKRTAKLEEERLKREAAEEPEEPGGLSWRERRHVARIARDAEKIALERLNDTRAQIEQGLEARFSAATAEAVQGMEGQLESANAEFADLVGKGRETVEELRDQTSEAGKQRIGLEESGAEIKAATAAAQDTVHTAIEKAMEELTTQADERRHVARMARDAEKIALERLNETRAQIEQELEARFSAATAEAVQAMEGQLVSARTEFADLVGKGRETVEELREQRVGIEETGAEIQAQSAAAQDTVHTAIEKAIDELTTQADERRGLSWNERRHVARIARDAEKIALERLNETRAQIEQGLEARFSAATAEAVQGMEGQLESANTEFADLVGKGRETVEELRNQTSEAGKQRIGLEESGAEIKAATAAAQDTVHTAIEKAMDELATQADERVKRISEGAQEATDLAEKIAVERLNETRAQIEQGLEARFSAATAEAVQAMEGQLESARTEFADLVGKGRETVEELRNQTSEAGKQRIGLEESGAEIKAATAAAQDTVHTAIEKAMDELATQADERVKRISEGAQEATDLVEGLRNEFSGLFDTAVQRVNQSSADLDRRVTDFKRTAEELGGRMQSAGERATALKQGIREQSEEALAALKAEGDRQTERLNSRFVALEEQRTSLEQQTAAIQKEGGAAREQAVELEEMVKTATTEMATLVGASQRELNDTLAASKELVASAAADREQEHEQWERVRIQVAEELDSTASEIRSFFQVQLAGVRSRVEAIAEASGVAAPSIPDPESSPDGWIPSQSITDPEDVDLNSAGVSELRALDLTMTQARRLIEHRERIGGFTSVDQIDEIPGFTADQRAGVKRRSTVN